MKQQATGGATREAVKEYLQQYHMARNGGAYWSGGTMYWRES